MSTFLPFTFPEPPIEPEVAPMPVPVPFSVIGKNGEVIYGGTTFEPPPLEDGQTLLGISPPSFAPHWWDGREFHAVPDAPDPFCLWDWPTKKWVDGRDIEAWRRQAWFAIKMARELRENDGRAVIPWGVFDCDEKAAVAFSAALATLADKPDGWTVAWTLKDNTAVILDAAALREVATKVLAYREALHAIGRQLRDQIQAATRIDQVVAVRWPG